MSDPALTPEVLGKLATLLAAYEIAQQRYEAGEIGLRDHLLERRDTARRALEVGFGLEAPALLAAAQRVQEMEKDLGAHVAELAAIDDALGPLTEATRQAQVRGLVARIATLERALVAMAIPYEGIRGDGESRRWIAPQIWEMIVQATETARALAAARQAEKETTT